MESVAGALIVAAALPFAFLYARAMATTSLWNDEIFTILNHSGKGPASVLTDYSSNSHLLFNLVNSVLPGRESLEPTRARGVSFIAVAALLAGVLWVFHRMGHWLVGTVVFAALAMNREMLDLFLQARGYGLTGFLALVTSAAFLDCRERPEGPGLLALAVGSVLGCFSLPTFAFWVAPLWLLLLWRSREPRVLIGLLSAALGVVAIHAGVLGQMISLQLGGYAAKLGYQYASVASVFDTLRLYLLGALGTRSDWFIALSVVVFLVLLVASSRAGEVPGSGLDLLLSAALFFVICLVLRTPIVRTTSFIAVPLLIGSALVCSAFIPASGSRRIRTGVALAFAVLAVGIGARRVHQFQFTPIENWMETAGWLTRVFPGDVRLHVTTAEPYMAPYLVGRHLEARLDEAAFATGRMVVADTPMVEDERQILPGDGSARVTDLKIIQRRNGFQRVVFAVPERSLLSGPAALRDRDLRTCAAGDSHGARLLFERRLKYRSLAVTHAVGKPPDRVELETPHGKAVTEWSLHQDGLSLYGLGDQEIESVEIQMPPGSCLAEVWAYPVSFGQGRNE